MRRTGFTDELDALGMDYEIVASAPGDWTAEGGARVCREVLELETVQDLPRAGQDLIAVGIWSVAIVVSLWALWYAHREKRI